MCWVILWCKELKINSNVSDYNKQTTKKETIKFYFDSTLLLLHRFDVYTYTNFIYTIYSRVDIKH